MNTTTDSVRIVLFDEANPSHFLALTETEDRDNLKLPGGKFDNVNETPGEAAARELEEELGVTPDQVGLTKAGELPNDDGKSERHIYMGRIAFGDLHPSPEVDHLEPLGMGSIPDGQNRGHMLMAVELVQRTLQTEIAR